VRQRAGQHAIQTALGGYQSINDLVLPPGRLLEQRNRTWELLNDIPGVSCVKPMGALYAFPRIDPKVCPILNDEKFVLDLLLSEKLLVVQGTAFNWPWPDHFRVVTLPRVDDLEHGHRPDRQLPRIAVSRSRVSTRAGMREVARFTFVSANCIARERLQLACPRARLPATGQQLSGGAMRAAPITRHKPQGIPRFLHPATLFPQPAPSSAILRRTQFEIVARLNRHGSTLYTPQYATTYPSGERNNHDAHPAVCSHQPGGRAGCQHHPEPVRLQRVHGGQRG
jgi:hypothetical protein